MNEQNAFIPQISMMDGLTHNQPICCLTYCLPFCSAYYTRYRVLDGDMSRYVCCQGSSNLPIICRSFKKGMINVHDFSTFSNTLNSGYMDNYCFHAGSCGERNCPTFCLCVESLICVGPSMSSSRVMVMDQYGLRSDPCDNRVIRLANCLQILSW